MKRIFICLLLLMALGLCVCQPAYADNDPSPVGENMELVTFRNASVGGQLVAHDPEGGQLRFVLTTKPVKGELELKEDGSFVYTPEEGKKGRDYFGYKVSDSEGNISQEATVIIRIQKPEKDVYYSDMDGRADEYAAMFLRQQNIFTPERIGDQNCFYPEKTVSCNEFMSMCKALTGVEPDKGAASNGNITTDEAAAILDEAVGKSLSFDNQPEPALMACASWDTALTPDYLTRADAAKLLCAAFILMNR